MELPYLQLLSVQAYSQLAALTPMTEGIVIITAMGPLLTLMTEETRGITATDQTCILTMVATRTMEIMDLAPTPMMAEIPGITTMAKAPIHTMEEIATTIVMDQAHIPMMAAIAGIIPHEIS